MLDPFPEGWYFVARRRAIERSGLLKKTWLGNRVVAWCNDAGDVCVAEAVCPHLGGDLSPDAGGRVRDGCLVCPFHGFAYDATGQCVATPYAPAPKSARLRVFETTEVAGLEIFTYDVSAVTSIHGLGYSLVEVREHSIGIDSRLWVLATPVDGTDIEMTLVSQTRLLRRPKRPVAGMRFLPVRLRTWLLNRILASAQRKDVLQDVAIWSRKTFLPRPLLCRSDGETMKFRRYCEQFYPNGQPPFDRRTP